MISIISPAKSLNFEPFAIKSASTPEFANESKILLGFCKKLSAKQLQKIMSISEKLGALNYDRFQNFETQPKKCAVFAYNGDVYEHLNVTSLDNKQLGFLQEHALIVSGLYGLLKPLDYIQPYRLEMSTRLPGIKNKSLYEFWQEKLTKYLNEALKKHENKYLVNLASGEYSDVVDQKLLEVPIITINFKEHRNGKLQTIGLNAKKARGMMLNFIVNNFIDEPEELKGFKKNGYGFSPENSKEKEWVFVK